VARRNADETIRDLERKAATGDRAALERLVAARIRSGVSVRDKVADLLGREIGVPKTTEGRERDLETVARAVAWVLSAPAPAENYEGRPWAWDELSHGSVLVVRHRDGDVTIGVHQPDPDSEWSIRFQQTMDRMAERAQEEDREQLRAHRLPPPYHPGTSWPELAHPAGFRPGDVCYWDRYTKRSYSWTDMTPAIARWSDQEAADRVRLTEVEARWFVREVMNGIDISDHDEVMMAFEDPVARNRLTHLVSQVDLMKGVMPPPEQGLRPENAAGTGWADWAARRLVQILSARRADRKDLTVIPRRPLDMEVVDPARFRHRSLEDHEEISRAYVLVFFRGAVTPTSDRTRRSAWERVQDKSILVEIMFPLDMTEKRWGGDIVTPNGVFTVSTGHGRYGSMQTRGEEHDHAPYGLQGLAKVVEDAIHDFFPGADLRTYWHW